LAPHYKQSAKEIRELAKSIIELHCDITVNNENKMLNITLYSLANPRANPALSKAIELINQTQYSGTNLTLFFCQNATP
jgi:DNA polymerase sigma